jgi:kynurenine formamidase
MSQIGAHEPGAGTPYDELPVVGGVASAWGAWGSGDAVGAINRLDEHAVRVAVQTVTRGTVVPLNWSMAMPDPPLYERIPMAARVVAISPFAQDDVLDNFNTQASTQWDGFRHIRLPGHGYYNGAAEETHGVHAMHDHGVVGRGVLVDVDTWRHATGQPLRHGESDIITVADIEATLADQRTTIESGDVLLVRTGWINWYEQLDVGGRSELAKEPCLPAVGLDPSEDMARYLWDAQISAVAADNPGLEVAPIGGVASADTLATIERDPSQRYLISLHSRLMVMLGIPFGELFALDTLASQCRARSRYSFLFVSVPFNLPNGIGTPANAIAIL